ncbi:MAG: STAS domain-containing protein [Jatrophihabitans sp.]|uniref:STAS domain-containing protein n=1 Tax=Jatrophihabitans sp. TaxID=1932789 RepID=UPI003914FEAC
MTKALPAESVVVLPAGELDMAEVDAVRAMVGSALARPGIRSLALDVANVTFIDSSIIGAFLTLHRDAAARQVGLRLVNVPHQLKRTLNMAGMHAILDYGDSET